MKAVGYKKPLPIANSEALLDIEVPEPVATGRDLLVEVKAVSVNPVDVKVRANTDPPDGSEHRILGWDAAGIVRATGPGVTLFKTGQEVFYAGSLKRPGTNAEMHLVDERIVGRMPKSLSFAEAAALPLTGITAWELLFDRLGAKRGGMLHESHILIIGGSGGVGSILIQLAAKLTNLTVIVTASRPETRRWCLELGAHHVIDHTQPFAPQLGELGIPVVERIASLTATDKHYPAVIDVLAAQGKFGLIDDPKFLDATALKPKSASLHWEFMFARSMFDTSDIMEQHRLLNEISELVDTGVIRTTLSSIFGSINAGNLRRAHELIESAKARGKIVLEGF